MQSALGRELHPGYDCKVPGRELHSRYECKVSGRELHSRYACKQNVSRGELQLALLQLLKEDKPVVSEKPSRG